MFDCICLSLPYGPGLGWMLNKDNEALWRLDVELLFSRTDFPAILNYQGW